MLTKTTTRQIIGGKKMEPNIMLNQMLAFNKTAYDNSFNAMLMIQEQNAKMVDTFLEQATWMPEEGKKLIRNWVGTYKKGCEDFKKAADENYKKVDEFFAGQQSA
jgi:hypothetical protein